MSLYRMSRHTPRPDRIRTPWRAGLVAAATAAVLVPGSAGVALGAPGPGETSASDTEAAADRGHPGPQLEELDRGLVAAVTDAGVFLSWRLLREEATGHSATGVTGTDFAVYRGRTRLATVTDSTNYLDAGADGSDTYRVVPLKRGRDHGRGTKFEPWATAYVDLPLTKPADGVTPKGEAYTYSANDMSVGDVDGDGALEYVVKWDPSNSKDVSQRGYTGSVYLDTYELDGTLKYRLDLGVNIRAGAHYTQFLVYDFDGNGKAEIMLKTAPGTRTISYRRGLPSRIRYITMPRADIRAGYSHADDYRLSAADYYEHVVEMFQGWSSRPEVTSGQWPATLEEAFGIAPQPGFTRDQERALAALVDVVIPADEAPGGWEGGVRTPIRSLTPTPARWPTTSWTSTPPRAASTTGSGSSRASSSTGPST